MPTNTPVIISYSMLAPGPSGSMTTTKVNGRAYSATAGTLVASVPGFDAHVLEANGWIKTTSGGSGATAARPFPPKRGQTFYDTTVGAMVIWNGVFWAHEATGASA